MFCALLFAPNLAKSQDSVWHQSLSPVEVSSQFLPSSTQSTSPTQVVTPEKIERAGITQVADAVRTLAGCTVKDYGGVGGVKTVSARGLGSQFSALSIDGIVVEDAQNGQVDLGRYLVGGCAFISFTNGMEEDLLQSAHAAASGSLISMRTAIPAFGSRKDLGAISLEGGSFGYLSPSLLWQHKIDPRWSSSLWMNLTRSEGDYPFTLYYTPGRQDSCSREIRQNSGMEMVSLDGNLNYYDLKQAFTAKIHFMDSRHELPGPVTYYTAQGSERTEEDLFFVQGRYQRAFGSRWEMLLLGRYRRSNDIYEDTAVLNSAGFLRNEYRQSEGFLSGCIKYSMEHLQLALASDETLLSLLSNLPRNNDMRRWSNLTSLSMRYRNGRVSALLSGTNTLIRDEEASYKKFSPYAALSLRIAKGVKLRYFFKESYRVPSFNELYYFTLPRDLKPERAMQHNFGITCFSGSDSCLVRHLSATFDLYRNRLRDKLVAIPTQNMFLWSMQNLGLVDILGADLCGEASLQLSEGFSAIFSLSYSYQKALDHTDPESKFYGHQIPYTPRHSGSLSLSICHRWADLDYSCMLVGRRYAQSQNVPQCLVPGYADHSIGLTKKISASYGTWLVQLRVLNLLDKQYEVVKNYPMMGRNFRIKIIINL